MDRTSTKVAKSHGKARVIESRKRTWDEVNVVALAEIGKELPTKKEKKADKEKRAEDEAVRAFYADDDDDDEDMDKDGSEWEDDVEGMDQNAAVESLMAAATIPAVAPVMQDDDEEIL